MFLFLPHLEPSLHNEVLREFWRLHCLAGHQLWPSGQEAGVRLSAHVVSFPPHLRSYPGLLLGVGSGLAHPSLRPSVSAGVGAGLGFPGCPRPVPSPPRPACLTPPRKAPLLGAGVDPTC